MSPKPAGVSNEQAKIESRQRLLDAGAALMLEQGRSNPFAALRLRAVCDRAGLSSGAFYVHWDDLGSYFEELGHHLLDETDEVYRDDFDDLAKQVISGAALPTLDAVFAMADTDLSALVRNPLWDAQSLLSLTWGRTDEHRPNLVAAYQKMDAGMGEAYGQLLTAHGREVRPPFNLDQLGLVLQALIEGMGLRAKIDPGAVESSRSGASMYGVGAASLISVLTRKQGDTEDLSEVLDRLLA